jgi:hypothetical protein
VCGVGNAREVDRLPRSKAAAQRQGRELAELTRRELDLGSDALGDVAGVLEHTVSERAVVALMEHFGVSMAALIYQLNIIGVVSYGAGQQLRSRGMISLVELHREVAPSGAATTVNRWELARLSETAPYPHLRGDQFLDGYSEIAHAVMTGPDACPASRIQRQVAAMLADRWGLAPGEAEAQARDIK